ncbi:MAG: hypothetical protein AB1714_27900 [Acidobacteriota bacterium]
MTRINGSMPIAVTINNSHLHVDPTKVKGGSRAADAVGVTINNNHRPTGGGVRAPNGGDYFERPKTNFFGDFARGAPAFAKGAPAVGEKLDEIDDAGAGVEGEELEGGPEDTAQDGIAPEDSRSDTDRGVEELVGASGDNSSDDVAQMKELDDLPDGSESGQGGVEPEDLHGGPADEKAVEEVLSGSAERREGLSGTGGRAPIPRPGTAGPGGTQSGGDVDPMPQAGLSAGMGAIALPGMMGGFPTIGRSDPGLPGGAAGPSAAPTVAPGLAGSDTLPVDGRRV